MQCLRTTRIPITLGRARAIPRLHNDRLAAMSTAAGNDPLTAGLSAVPVQPEDKSAASLKFADIGINLSDPIFRGVYHGKKAHEDDLPQIVQRA
ncbi:hypothetical protein KCU66_g12762, partial [Aureobasidium melanogenum]